MSRREKQFRNAPETPKNKLPAKENVFGDLPHNDELYEQVDKATREAYAEGREAVNAAMWEERALGKKDKAA